MELPLFLLSSLCFICYLLPSLLAIRQTNSFSKTLIATAAVTTFCHHPHALLSCFVPFSLHLWSGRWTILLEVCHISENLVSLAYVFWLALWLISLISRSSYFLLTYNSIHFYSFYLYFPDFRITVYRLAFFPIHFLSSCKIISSTSLPSTLPTQPFLQIFHACLDWISSPMFISLSLSS